MDFTSALGIATAGFETWKNKTHNARWFRKIDGTPIPNDLLVNIAEAFGDALANPAAIKREAPLGVVPEWSAEALDLIDRLAKQVEDDQQKVVHETWFYDSSCNAWEPPNDTAEAWDSEMTDLTAAIRNLAAAPPPPANIGADSPSDPHFIRRHGAFFRPNRAGYCTDIAGAGIYSGEEARTYLDVEGLTIHPVSAYASEIALVLKGADRLRAALLATPAEGGGDA